MVHALETMSINVEVEEDWKENYFKRTKYSKEAIDNLKLNCLLLSSFKIQLHGIGVFGTVLSKR